MFDLTLALNQNQPTLLPISSILGGQFGYNDICLSLPALVSNQGVQKVLEPQLTPEELSQFQQSANLIQNLAKEI
jgi:L-lactate dehydrogenase